MRSTIHNLMGKSAFSLVAIVGISNIKLRDVKRGFGADERGDRDIPTVLEFRLRRSPTPLLVRDRIDGGIRIVEFPRKRMSDE